MEECRSVTAALDAIGFGRVQLLLLLYCGLTWLADACETMILSFLGPAVRCAWGLGPGGESLLSSVVFAGMLVGVYSLGLAADVLGRRRGFLLSALLLGASGLASALAPSFGWLLLLRCIVGFALGGTPIAVTLFAEFCTSGSRGRFVLLMQSFWTVGTMLEAALAWAVIPSLGWRYLLALSAAPLLVLLVLYPLLPESPHWLVAKGRYAEAEAVLLRVAAANGHPQLLRLRLDPSSVPVPAHDHAQLWAAGSGSHGGMLAAGVRSRSPALAGVREAAPTGMQAPLLAAQQPLPAGSSERRDELDQPPLPLLPPQQAASQPLASGSNSQHGCSSCGLSRALTRRRLHELLRTLRGASAAVFGPALRRTTLLLWCIWLVNAITYYGLVLLTTALQTAAKKEDCTHTGAPNLDGDDFWAILVTTVAEAPGLLVAALLIDVRGRKWTLRAGLAVCAASLASLVVDPSRGLQLGLLFMARACIEGTFSVLYVYTPELYPTAVRSIGLALCNGFSRLGGFAAPFATVGLVEMGHKHAAELLLAGLCGMAVLCALALPYETQGRDLHGADLVPDSAADGSGSGKEHRSRRHSYECSQNHSTDAAVSELQGVGVHPHATDGESELVPTHENESETGPLLPSS